MTTTQLLTATFKDKAVQDALAKLPARLAVNAQKRALRAALQPVQRELRSAWLGASFKGKAPHRKAIAAAHRIDVRRVAGSDSAVTRARLGVDYAGLGGGASRTNRQKIWHLLEFGFRHYSKGSGAYRGATGAARQQATERKAWLRTKRDELRKTIKGRSFKARVAWRQAQKQLHHDSGTRFAGWWKADQAKKATMVTVRAGASRRIAGRGISTTVVARMLDATTRLCAQLTLREAAVEMRKVGIKCSP